jgi:hypothetical protein
MFFCFFTLCSARVSACVIVLSDSLCEEIGKLGTCPLLQIIGEHLAGAPVSKTDTLLGVSRVTAYKVMLAYTIHRKTLAAKRNSGQKSKLTERDCMLRRTA